MEAEEQEIYAERRETLRKGMTPNGGWTREQLEKWGVPWPPPTGWKDSIVMNGFPYKKPEPEVGEGS